MKEKVDVKKFSDIKYSVNELEEVIMDDKKTLRYEFEPLDGKIIVSTMFRLKACGRGKNIIHLLSESEEDVISIWCEGMGIYSYEGEEKRHLGRDHDNEWVSVWVSIDITSQTYDVCLDGRRCITGARIMSRVKNVSILESYSRLGKYSLKHIFVYRNPIQSVNDLAELQNIYDAMEMGIQPNGCIPVTKELQYLIDTCSLSGGGVVYLKGGI